MIKEDYAECDWDDVVWFKYATPRYAFIHWVTMHDRLSTGSRMMKWSININPECVFCREPIETKEHLFLDCPYSAKIWEELTKGFLREFYTTQWQEIVSLLKDSTQQRIPKFTLRYVFQAALYTVWRERNARRHGEKPSPESRLIHLLDRNMRDRYTTIQRMERSSKYEEGLRFWIATRNMV